MTNTHSYSNTGEEWENGELGASEAHVQRLPAEEEVALDEALGLRLISIRLQKSLVEELKKMAKESGIGYQPLIRQILTAHVRQQHRHLRFAS